MNHNASMSITRWADLSTSSRASCLVTSLSLFAGAVVFSSPRTARADSPVVDVDPQTSASALTANIPASGNFTAKYAFDGEVQDAVLDVWPNTLQACEKGPPAVGTRQTYRLPLTLKTEDGKTTGTTLVPHLQVAERFCLRFSYKRVLTPSARQIEDALKRQPTLITTPDEANSLAEKLVAATVDGQCSRPNHPAPGKGPCDDIDTTALRLPLLEAVLDADVKQAELTALNTKHGTLEAAITAMRGEVGTLGAVPPALEAEVPSPKWLEGDISTPRLKKAIQAVADNEAKLKPNARKLTDWLNKMANLQAQLEQVDTKQVAAVEAAAKAQDRALATQRDVVLEFLKNKLRAQVQETPLLIQSDTNDFNNYLSPEIGMAVAHPFLKNSDTTLVPYTAVNFYLSPVDRELAIGQLVNPFVQRFSVTLGLSLTQNLKTSHADYDSTVAGTFGIVGAGYRVLPFARVAGLLILANAKPSGGLSAESKLVAAGALAISADVDVVTFLTSSLKK